MRGVPTLTGSHTRHLDGGILVFFPSYGTMESAAARWKQTGLWERLCGAGGHVMMESRGSAGAGSVSSNGGDREETSKTDSIMVPANKWSSDMEDYNPTASSHGNDGSHLGVVREFEQALMTQGRCILLAVCRGKVSEGIDFRDNKGRIAIITGELLSLMLCMYHNM
jgi:fanconi anemia group J protein